MAPQSVGIIGMGAFGTLCRDLIHRFLPAVEIRTYSRNSSAHDLEKAAQADVVLLCVPIAAYEDLLQTLVPLVRPETVIVDVATVKGYTMDLIKKWCKGRRFVSLHGMFGPESYAKKGNEVTGLRIVVTGHTLAEKDYRAAREWLSSLGFDVIEMTAHRHDKHLAETLFLTHLVGQVISRAGFARSEIDTVSFGYLMDAVESVKHDTKLFQDVYRFNPHCKKVLRAFEKARNQTRKTLTPKKRSGHRTVR